MLSAGCVMFACVVSKSAAWQCGAAWWRRAVPSYKLLWPASDLHSPSVVGPPRVCPVRGDVITLGRRAGAPGGGAGRGRRARGVPARLTRNGNNRADRAAFHGHMKRGEPGAVRESIPSQQ